MKFIEACEHLLENPKKILVLIHEKEDFGTGIYFLFADELNKNNYCVKSATLYKDIDEKLEISNPLITKHQIHNEFVEINHKQFNYLWELELEKEFPELKEAFEYYDQVKYKEE